MYEQPRILIVEDDALTALMLSNLVTGLGCQVVGLASTGPRAVALADYHRPDLVLVDAKLAKGTDGLDAAREMREHLKLDVIVISGWTPPEDDDVLADVPWVRKPFAPEHVRQAVRSMLGSRLEAVERLVAQLAATNLKSVALPALTAS